MRRDERLEVPLAKSFFFDEGHREADQRRFARDAASSDAATDDEQVEAAARQCRELLAAPAHHVSHRMNSKPIPRSTLAARP